MTALALGGEHPAFPDPQILHLQTQDLAAAQPTEHHRRHHGLVSVGVQHHCRASTSTGVGILGNRQVL